MLIRGSPQGCKVLLQAPSSTCMPACSPFLPPPAITQVMLIANPNQVSARTNNQEMGEKHRDDICFDYFVIC